jgi:type IX secretion system PorP/SprF family membrane protein
MAQDAQFSHQAMMPLALNPALAGAASDLQMALLHRDQRVAGSEPFRTTAVAFEACLNPITRERRVQHGRSGLGISVVNDRSGTPAFRTTDIQASLAYQLFIDGYSGVGAGIQAGLRQQVFDPLAGTWASQYNGMRHDPTLPHGESIGAESLMRPDVGAGMYYTFRRMPQPRKHSNTLEFHAGAAVFHAARPDLSVFDQYRDRLYRRWVFHAQGEIGSGRVSFEPAAYLHMQGPSQQLLAGFNLRRQIGETGGFFGAERSSSMALGLFTRNGTALVATLDVRWGNYGIGVGYDFALNRAVPNAAPMGAAEFAFRYMVPAATGARR